MRLLFLMILILFLSSSVAPVAFGSPIKQIRKVKDRALFFAVEDYKEWPDLQKPVEDAEEIARDLRDLYAFETEIVRNPTRNQIYDKLEAYQQKQFSVTNY